VGLSLADIEKWDSSSIDAVASAADGQGRAIRLTADQLGMIVDGVRWDGHAADAARAAMWETRQELYRHADEYQAVAQAASRSAPQVAALKQELRAIHNEAAAFGITVDSVSGSVTWHIFAGQLPDERMMIEAAATDIAARLTRLLQDANRIDTELADAINDAGDRAFGIGPDFPSSPGFGPRAHRSENETAAFRAAFGRDPATQADWDTAAALDPHSYDTKNDGVPPHIVVGHIRPVPGQGVVRTNLFIPGDTAWTPSGDNLGDGRGFNPLARPEESRVSILVDYENGIIVARQNPSVMNGQARTGTPDVRVSQKSNGSVLIDYHAADPYSPGGEDLAKASPWHVNGRLVIKPTDAGPVAGGLISDFPAIEIYNDRAGVTDPLAGIMPWDVGPEGPLVGLPLTQKIGAGLMGEFPDDVWGRFRPVPEAPLGPVGTLYPSAELGPVDQGVRVPVGQ
jgi:hypothetical protein